MCEYKNTNKIIKHLLSYWIKLYVIGKIVNISRVLFLSVYESLVKILYTDDKEIRIIYVASSEEKSSH